MRSALGSQQFPISQQPLAMLGALPMLPRILGRSSKGFKVPPCHLFRLAQCHRRMAVAKAKARAKEAVGNAACNGLLGAKSWSTEGGRRFG